MLGAKFFRKYFDKMFGGFDKIDYNIVEQKILIADFLTIKDVTNRSLSITFVNKYEGM